MIVRGKYKILYSTFYRAKPGNKIKFKETVHKYGPKLDLYKMKLPRCFQKYQTLSSNKLQSYCNHNFTVTHAN